MDFPDIDPVIFAFTDQIAIRWYGLMFLFTFVSGLLIANRRARLQPYWGMTKELNSDLMFYIVLGTILGGRLGSVFFYNFDRFLEDPFMIYRFWDGGMSFHGGFLGVVAAYFWFAKKHKLNVFTIADYVVLSVPLGIAAVRFANFINKELWGRVTDVPWALNYNLSFDPEGTLRHPSPLYEMVLEGFLIFAILLWFCSKPRPRLAASGLFMLLYGVTRTFAEQFRQPDIGIEFLLSDWIGEWLTMGMLLSAPLIIAGIGFMVVAYKRPIYENNQIPEVEEKSSKPTGKKTQKKKGKRKK